MSQPVSDRSTVLDSTDQPSADLRFDLSQEITSLEMENNADSLMNELFADVDRMLERGVSLSVEPPVVEEPKPEPVVPIDAILPPKLAPRDLIPQPLELLDLESKDQATSEQTEATAEPSSKGWSPLWLAVLCSSLLLSAGILCFLFRDQVTRVWLSVLGKSTSEPIPATVSASPTDPKSQDSDFLEYLGRSLDRLARKPEIEPSPVASASPSPSVVERVYVPVYPSTQTTTLPSPTAAGAPQTPAATPAKPAAVPRVAANPLPSVAATVPNIAATTHTLIGILELGDRSAALFDVNGTPQRFKVGETIGSSGWTLVSISNQEAIVRRNGEVRSIHIGQKF